MDQQELNIRMHHKDEDGNVSILHPITDLKNVNGLEDALGGVHDAIDGINAQSGLGIGMAGTGEHAEVFNDYENNTASGEYAHAEGGASQAGGKYSHAEGFDCQATGNYSHAEGSHTESANDCAHAEGVSTIASGLSAHAEGHSTIAKGNYSHTEGRESVAEHLYAHVEGRNTKSSADYQHVQGKYNATSGTGNMAHIVGNGEDGDSRSNAHTLDWDGNAWFAGDVTSGEDISLAKTHERERALNQVVQPEDSIYENAGKPIPEHLEELHEAIDGINAQTGLGVGMAGAGEHAEVFNDYENNTASGDHAHAEGFWTTAQGARSHAEGTSTVTRGSSGHAEGFYTEANGRTSHAEGSYTIAAGDRQHVQGKYNLENADMAHIVGNGENEDSRSNAHTLDWDGNAWFAGDVISGEDISLAKTHERERTLNRIVKPEDGIYENFDRTLPEHLEELHSTKVDKADGKGLSTKDYTAEDQIAVQETFPVAIEELENGKLDKTEAQQLLDGKVDKVDGKGLSSNDYTTADQTAVQNELPSRLDEVETTLKNLPTEVNDITEILKGKVDVEEGKGLSSNDFTNSHKTKLDALPDNSALSASLAGKVDKADGKGLSTNDYTTADQTAVQSTLPNRIDTLEGKLNSFPEEWEEIGDLLDSKVDKVDGKDLSTNDYDNAAKSIVDSVPEQIAAINETAQNAGKTAEEAKTDVQSLQDDVVNYLNPDAFSIGNLLKFDGERLVPAVRGVDYDAGNGGSISGDSIVSYYESPLEFKLVLSEASLENAIIARDEDAISQLFCVFDKIQLPHQAGAILGQEISFHFDGFDESEEALAVLLLETFSVVVNVVIQLLGTVSAVAAMLLYGLDEEEAIAFTEAFMQCSYYNAKAIWLGQLIDLNDILAYDADGNFTGFNVDTWQNKVSAKHLRTVRYTPKDGTTTIKYIPKFIESLPFTMAFTLLGMPTAENKDFAELLMALALAPIALLAQLDREINQLYQNGESKYDNLEAFIKRFEPTSHITYVPKAEN